MRFVNTTLGRQTELVRAAVKTYELDNIGRKGSREQIQHFIDVDANFRTWRSLAEEILANCRTAVTRFDNETRRLSQAFALLPPPEQPVRMPELLTEAFKTRRSFQSAKSACRVGQGLAEVPRRQEFGSYMGPFGSMAFWLLKTESLPFVLITGLLGFGLLGAGCSTFVRYRERQADALAAEHVGGVIIRGTSAAVVVFLGVYGGLATFLVSHRTERVRNIFSLLFSCGCFQRRGLGLGSPSLQNRIRKASDAR